MPRYTLCAEYSFFGDPIVRPIWWLDASAEAARAGSNISSSSSTQPFLVGSQIYVQPILHSMLPRETQQQQTKDTSKQHAHEEARQLHEQQQQQQHEIHMHQQLTELHLPRGLLW